MGSKLLQIWLRGICLGSVKGPGEAELGINYVLHARRGPSFLTGLTEHGEGLLETATGRHSAPNRDPSGTLVFRVVHLAQDGVAEHT